MQRYATNIGWDYDEDEPFEAVEDMTVEKASELLGVPVRIWSNMNDNEKYDYIADAIRHTPAFADEILGLPEKVEIPDELTEIEDITDYISDKYGFCISGYEITIPLKYGNVEDFKTLAEGDVIGVEGIGRTTVLGKPYYNSDCDEPGWEVETDSGVISISNDITKII